MQTLEIMIEENAFGAVRPVEVAADAPVAALVPALVKELNLPQTDLFGNQLVYMLRYSSEGRMLPEDKSLAAAGIAPGAKLALDSYVMNGSVVTLMKHTPQSADPAFHSSGTLADNTSFPILQRDTSTKLPAVKKRRRLTRRAFLMLGGAILGAGSVGLGYAAYRSILHKGSAPIMHPAPPHIVATQHVVAPPTVPTMAKPMLSFTQHQQPVRSVAWSPDGTMIASGADDAQLLIWDVQGMVHVSVHQGNPVRTLAWSPDGQQMVTGSGNQVTFLKALNGTIVSKSGLHNGMVTSLAWSKLHPEWVVSGALDKQAIVWDTTTYRPQTRFKVHTSPIEAVSWAADGQTVGSASQGGVVRVWNAATGQEVHGYFFDMQVHLRALTFATSGTQLAVGGDDGIVRIWNGLTCQQQQQGNFGMRCLDVPQRLNAHTKAVHALAWSPDGRLLAIGGDDNMLTVWYPARGQRPLTIQLDAPLRAISWSPGGKQLATAAGNTVTIWGLM